MGGEFVEGEKILKGVTNRIKNTQRRKKILGQKWVIDFYQENPDLPNNKSQPFFTILLFQPST